jgi:hypothetical protein
MAFTLLKRNGGLEDHATMSRLAAGKRHEYQRYNIVLCKACQGDFRGFSHPLRRCSNIQMVEARKLWMDNCRSHAQSAKPVRLRRLLLEILHHVWSSNEGEFAAVGTFTPGWVKRVDDGSDMSAQDLNAVKKLLRVIACGARLVMREYARLKTVSEGDAKETRQLSMTQFVSDRHVPKDKEKKCAPVGKNAPPDTIWIRSSLVGRTFRWARADGIPAAQEMGPGSRTAMTSTGELRASPSVMRRRLQPDKKWKSGLNWFSAKSK